MAPQTQAPRLIESYYSPDELRTATVLRRLGGSALDILFFVLLLLTLTIGWWIWFAIVAPGGQSPGKQLLGMYIVREDSSRAGGGYTWLREIVVKWVLFWNCIRV